MKIFLVLLTASLFLLGGFKTAFAQIQGASKASDPISKYIGSLTSNCTTEEIAGIFCIIAKAINLLLLIAGAIAIALLVYGGIMYMASGGDEKQLGNAKAAVTYSIMGLLIILGAILLVNVVLGGLTG